MWCNIGDSYNAQQGNGFNGQKRMDHANRNVNIKRPAGLKAKDMALIPARLALALQADGWWVRSQIVWAKRNPMPESVQDRPVSSWETVWLLTKSARYYYDAEAVREEAEYGRRSAFRSENYQNNRAFRNVPVTNGGTVSGSNPEAGRNQRNVWHLSSEPYPGAHFATMPSEIPRRAIMAGTSERGCCPACGAPWTRVVERESS